MIIFSLSEILYGQQTGYCCEVPYKHKQSYRGEYMSGLCDWQKMDRNK
jgi:hypothetical protein